MREFQNRPKQVGIIFSKNDELYAKAGNITMQILTMCLIWRLQIRIHELHKVTCLLGLP
jgi:hypothetical protein